MSRPGQLALVDQSLNNAFGLQTAKGKRRAAYKAKAKAKRKTAVENARLLEEEAAMSLTWRLPAVRL